jgi:hypothetical protein
VHPLCQALVSLGTDATRPAACVPPTLAYHMGASVSEAQAHLLAVRLAVAMAAAAPYTVRPSVLAMVCGWAGRLSKRISR